MGKIVVFDSGLGSLSVINAIREATLSNMTYFADQRYFPYGVRSVADLRKIITERITMLEEKFRPEMIIVGSNTPTFFCTSGKLCASTKNLTLGNSFVKLAAKIYLNLCDFFQIWLKMTIFHY